MRVDLKETVTTTTTTMVPIVKIFIDPGYTYRRRVCIVIGNVFFRHIHKHTSRFIPSKNFV